MKKYASKNNCFVYVKGYVQGIGNTDIVITRYMSKYFQNTYLIISTNKRIGKIFEESGVKVINVRLRKLSIPFLYGIVLSILIFAKLVKILRKRKGYCIIMWSWGSFLPGAPMLKMVESRAKIFIDIRTHPIRTKDTISYSLTRALFRATLRVAEGFADGFTIITKSMLAYIKRSYGVLNKAGLGNTCVWSSGYDSELFDKVHDIIRSKKDLLKSRENKVILYYGSMDRARLDMLLSFIDAVKLILSKDSCPRNIKLLLIGDGDALPLVRDYVKKNNLGNHVVIHRPVPYSLVPLILELSDVVLSPYPLVENWLTQHPLKVVESIGALRPVIATPLYELRDVLPSELLLRNSREGVDPEELANRLCDILKADEKHRKDLLLELERLRKRFSWENIAKELYICFMKVIGKNER